MSKKIISQEEYRADPALSASDLKDILDMPYQWRTGTIPEPSESTKESMLLGTLFHAMILEPDTIDEHFVVRPDFNRRTKEGKIAYEEFIEQNADRNIISQEQADTARAMFEALREENLLGLFEGGENEHSFFSEYEGVKVKCRPDFYLESQGVIIDLKSIRQGGASKDSFERQIHSLKYHLQASHYLRITGAQKFYFCVVEKIAPYMIGVYELSDADIRLGDALCKKAIDMYKRIEDFKRVVTFDSITKSSVALAQLPIYAYTQAGIDPNSI